MTSLPDTLPPSTALRHRRTAADLVADELREAIDRGQIADGAVLNQVQLAEHFGVSRVPVREAMRQLQAEGLISVEAHRKAVVRGLSIPRIIETHELREMIEGYLVERATLNMTPKDLAAAVATEKQMRAETNHLRWLDLNAAFHRALYAPSGSETALELSEQLRSRAQRYTPMLGGGREAPRQREANREHARILKLVKAGDAAGAREAMQHHIRHTRDAFAALQASADSA